MPQAKRLKALQAGGDTVTVITRGGSDLETRYKEYQQVAARAAEVFGSEHEAGRWLSSPSVDFQNQTPLQALIANGPEGPLEVLGRIEHGVFF